MTIPDYLFNRQDHAKLAHLFDPREAYAGYRPNVVEAPNGDTKPGPHRHTPESPFFCDACGVQTHTLEGAPRVSDECPKAPRVPNVDAGDVCGTCGGAGEVPNGTDRLACGVCHGSGRVSNVDAAKRYLHVALKYNPPAWALEYLARAHFEICRVATALGVPAEYRPHEADTTLRVLEYPAGAGSVEHTDFDLFTIVCWRETPEDLERGRCRQDGLDLDGRGLSNGLHIGEIGELVGLGPATPHRVPPRPYVQRSIVAFAMPDHGARLPAPKCAHCRGDGTTISMDSSLYDEKTCPVCRGTGTGAAAATVGEWLAERIKRSRVVYK